jgi:hypothetical protein
VPSAQCPILKRVSLKVNVHFGSTYLSESGFSTMKILKSNYIMLTDKHLNDCMRVALTKYTLSYNKLAEELKRCSVKYHTEFPSLKGTACFSSTQVNQGF